MSQAMEVLSGDHRIFFQLLDLIEQEIEVFGRGEQPDYTLIEAILEFFQGYPDCAHHPAEDMVYDKLKKRAPELCSQIPDPCGEHRREVQCLNALVRLIRVVLAEGEIPRDTVIKAAHSFVLHMRNHMHMEEVRFLPAAAENLLAEDWAEIDSRLCAGRHALLRHSRSEDYDALREEILRWQEERSEEPCTAA